MRNNSVLDRLRPVAIFIPLLFTLTGCPGEGDSVPPWRPIQVTKEHVCFSVNKNDVLSSYRLSSVQKEVYKEFANKGNVALSWPDTYLDISLPTSYIYGVSYTLNNQRYRYVFYIDNDWHIHSPRQK